MVTISRMSRTFWLIIPLLLILLLKTYKSTATKHVNIPSEEVDDLNIPEDGMFVVKVSKPCMGPDGQTSGDEYEGLGSNDQTLVRVVDPKQINIRVADRMEMGSETEALVQVIDTWDDVIPADYHRLIHLIPESNCDVLSVTLAESNQTSSQGKQWSVFTIRGQKVGSCVLSFKASVTSVNGVINSPQIKIDVYAPFKIQPIPKLIVGASYQLKVTGGPENIAAAPLEFSVSDPSLASVTPIGIVVTKRIGETRVVVKLSRGSVIYLMDSISLEIVPLQGVKIVTGSQVLISGSSLNLMLNGLGPNDELLSPLSFGSVVPNLKITWSVSDPQIMELKCVFYPLGLCGSDRNEFLTRGTGVEEGTVTISVSVEVTQESKSSHQYQLENNRKMIDYIQVKVVSGSGLKNKITPNDPRLMILMSPGSEIRLESTKDDLWDMESDESWNTTYELRSNSCKKLVEITLDESSGQPVLKTSQKVSTAATLDMKDPLGVVSYPVLVQPVSNFMMVLDAKQSIVRIPDTVRDIHHLPLGSTVRFGVSFYNKFGQPFDAVSPFKTHIDVNRHDLIQYSWHKTENGHQALSVTGVKEGSTLVHIWTGTEDQVMHDYIQLTFDEIIEPLITEPPPVVTEEVIPLKDEAPICTTTDPSVIVINESKTLPEMIWAPFQFISDNAPIIISTGGIIIFLAIGYQLFVRSRAYPIPYPYTISSNFLNQFNPYAPNMSPYHQQPTQTRFDYDRNVHPLHHHSSHLGSPVSACASPSFRSPYTSGRTFGSNRPLTTITRVTGEQHSPSGSDSSMQQSPVQTPTSTRSLVGRPLWTSPRT